MSALYTSPIHPAYPSPATLRREGSVKRLADAVFANNNAVRAILDDAATRLDALDLNGYSMANGYDLSEIPAALRDMMPVLDGLACERLDRWAGEMVATGGVS